MRTHLVLVGLLAVAAAPAIAQEPGGVRADGAARVVMAPDALPGAVVSTVLQIERPANAASATYAVQAAEHVLLYGPPSGDVVIRTGTGLVPLTFSVPMDTPTDTVPVARLVVRWADGSRWAAEVRTFVGVRRGLELALDTSNAFVARGTTSHIGFVVRNTGNAADTIGITFLKPEAWLVDAPGPLVLEAGASHTDSLRIRMPRDAVYGETQIVRVSARGAGSGAARNLAVTVGDRDVEEGGLIRLPATVTVGAFDAGMLARTPVSLALEMHGSLGGGTEASLRVRRSPDAATPPAFYQYLTGPALRAELRNGPNRLVAGDVLYVASPLHGGSSFGTGVSASGSLGSGRANVLAARPHQFDGPERTGHLLGATAELTTALGAVGVSASDLARPAGVGGDTERARLAALTFRGTLAHGLTASAEAGMMTLRDGAGRTSEGLAYEVESAYHGGRVDLRAHVRRVPGSLPTSGSAMDETYLGGGLAMGHGLAVNGWFVRSETEFLGGGGSRHDGSALSLRWTGGGASAQVSGYLRRASGGGLLTGGIEQRSIAVGGAVPLGPVTAEGSFELGRANNHGAERTLRQITSRLSWHTAAARAWLSLSHSQGVFGSDLTRVDAGATVRRGRVELDGRLGTWMSRDASHSVDAWLSTTFYVTPQTALIAGIDYTPWRTTSDAARLSIGARHGISVPLPLHRPAQAHGLIYEDVNGNLQHDPGEPGVRGVRVRRGNTFVVTDPDGRYAFYSERSGAAEVGVDAGSLAQGLMLLPSSNPQARGRIDIPVVRAAALQLLVFEDRNRDARLDVLEAGAAGAVVELVDTYGRTRTASTDARGRASFAALPPGDYSATARVRSGQQAGTPVSFTLIPGGMTQVEIGAPRRAREIRFGVMPSGAADTTQADSVTILQTGGETGPLRSDAAARRASRLPGGESPTAPDPHVQGATTEQDRAGGHAPVASAEADSVTAPRRTGYAAGGWVIGMSIALALLLLLVGWRARKHRDDERK